MATTSARAAVEQGDRGAAAQESAQTMDLLISPTGAQDLLKACQRCGVPIPARCVVPAERRRRR